MSDLRSCPFCGRGKSQVDFDFYEITGKHWQVACGRCGSHTGIYIEKEGAAEHWNHRPIEDQLRTQLQAANERIERLKLVVNLAPKGCICHVKASDGYQGTSHSAWCRDYTEARAELEKETT